MLEYIVSNPSYLACLMISATITLIGLLCVAIISAHGGVLQHVKDDWTCRLPYRIRYNRYRGLSRSSYAILCLVYYPIKDLFLLVMAIVAFVIKFIFWDIWKWIVTASQNARLRNLDDEYSSDEEEGYADEQPATIEDETEELPFCQLFKVGTDMCLMVHHVEMCPDEVAFIRVVDDEGYTPLYKRKVRRDKQGNRYLVFNGTNYYLDDNKTQPYIKK